MIAGAAIQLGAQTAMHKISKTLTDKYLKKANDNFFGPRGLRVRLMKTEAMRQFVETLAAKPADSKMKSFGKSAARVGKIVGLHLPITRTVINAMSKPVSDSSSLSKLARIHQILEQPHLIRSPESTPTNPETHQSAVSPTTKATSFQ